MVLPLIIGAAVIIGGYIFLSNKGGALGGALDRLTRNEQERVLAHEKEAFEYQKSQRGLFQNIGAFFFGEKSLDEKQDQGKEIVNAVHTGTRDTSQQTYTPTLNTRSFKMKRGRSVFG